MTNSETQEAGRGWFIVFGILLIVTGVAALMFPFLASLSVELLIGLAFLTGGVFTLVQAFFEKAWRGFFWQLLIGILYAVAGIVFLVMPISGVIALTLMLGGVFTAEGIARIIMAFQVRPQRSWGWILASGGVSLLLGILVLAGMANGASLAFVGFLVGINFVFAGTSFIAVGSGHTELPDARPA